MREEQIAEMEDKVRQAVAKHGVEALLIRAPENPEQKKEWVERMRNLQILIWIKDGAKCAHCSHVYKDVEDFIKRNPKQGYFEKNDQDYFDKMFVCSSCWESYRKLRVEKP